VPTVSPAFPVLNEQQHYTYFGLRAQAFFKRSAIIFQVQ
jgi:hypothetical protein